MTVAVAYQQLPQSSRLRLPGIFMPLRCALLVLFCPPSVALPLILS